MSQLVSRHLLHLAAISKVAKREGIERHVRFECLAVSGAADVLRLIGYVSHYSRDSQHTCAPLRRDKVVVTVVERDCVEPIRGLNSAASGRAAIGNPD